MLRTLLYVLLSCDLLLAKWPQMTIDNHENRLRGWTHSWNRLAWNITGNICSPCTSTVKNFQIHISMVWIAQFGCFTYCITQDRLKMHPSVNYGILTVKVWNDRILTNNFNRWKINRLAYFPLIFISADFRTSRNANFWR